MTADPVAFAQLASEAAVCVRCPLLAERAAVLSPLNGSLTPRVLFVAEAPGRQGADRTRIPMHGDASGVAFEKLMASIGLTRDDIFITNAILCSPRSATDANRAPRASEVSNCSSFLRRTIEALDPPILVSLGGAALAALGRLEPHGLVLSSDVGRPRVYMGRVLLPLYHPSPQVLISRRSLAQQTEDWRSLRNLLEQLGYV